MFDIEVHALLVRVHSDLDCIVDRPTGGIGVSVTKQFSRMLVRPFHGHKNVE